MINLVYSLFVKLAEFYNANPGLSYAFVSVIVAVVLFATDPHVSME